MIKEELEKMFDEKFDLGRIDAYENGLAIGYVNQNEEVKQFIFNEIIPQVLKSVLNVETSKNDGNDEISYGTIELKGKTVLADIKQKVKENYGITL